MVRLPKFLMREHSIGTAGSKRPSQTKKAVRLLVADLSIAGVPFIAFVMLALLANSPSNSTNADYVTAPVVRGSLSIRVQAAGTVEPIRLVEVSTELSGMLKHVHAKPNDIVKAGQVLAELDPTAAQAQVARAQAVVSAARGRLKDANAGVRQTGADLERKQRLRGNQFASQRDLDAAEYASARSTASLETLNAELEAALADLNMAKVNLSKTRIVAPIDAVVLRRSAEPGQTIAATLQPPVLFRLAADLDQMQLRVDVDEADAMTVVAGQPATFRVQALRNRVFDARVHRIHVGPEIVQGVVTYKALLGFDNRRLRLKPGMTATAEITVEQVKDQLLVPNAAFRFLPANSGLLDQDTSPDLISHVFGIKSAFGSANVGEAGSSRSASTADVERRSLYVIGRNGALRKVQVDVGFTDGNQTVVTGGGLFEGQRVVIDHADVKR